VRSIRACRRWNTGGDQKSRIGRGATVDRGVAVLLTATAGGLIALQAPINAGLGRATGSMPAALISFLVGTVALAAIVVLSGKAGGLTSVGDVSWYYLVGGLLGAIYVANALIAVSSIGAGGVAAATVAGQLAASVAVDRLGLLGLDEIPLTPERILGVALLFVGTLLVVR
jgi:transporter family-2 protein